MKLKNNQTRKAIRLTLLSALCLSVFVMVSGLATAQTKSAKGINAGSSSIGAVVPEVANLESQVLETVTLMDDIEGCGAGNRFYDPDADVCRTTDPVDVEFTQSADETYVVIQNLNGIGEIRHPLDGEDGVATGEDGEVVEPDPEDPDNPDEEEATPRERERWICRRSGTTWEQGSNAFLSGRDGGAYYLCCEGMPESTSGPFAGYIARQWPGIREHCP